MSLNAPYSLAKSGTNPFWTEPQTSSHDAAGQQQMPAATAKEDSRTRSEANRESQRSSNSYVPPETMLAKIGHDSRGNLENENVNDPQKVSCSAGPGYPAPADSSNVQSSQANMQSQSFSCKNPTVSRVISDHTKKERPHSLQVTTSGKPAETGAQYQGQKSPVKGILKKPSGSVSFDTTIQISDGGNISSDTLLTTQSTGFIYDSDYSGITNKMV